jgi:hypothetical protein
VAEEAFREVAAVIPAGVVAAGAAFPAGAMAVAVTRAAVRVRRNALGAVWAGVTSRDLPPGVTSLDPRAGVTFRAPPAVAAISPLRISPAAVSPSLRVARDRVVGAFRRAARNLRPLALVRQRAAAQLSCHQAIEQVAEPALARRKNLPQERNRQRNHPATPGIDPPTNLPSFRLRAPAISSALPPAPERVPHSEARWPIGRVSSLRNDRARESAERDLSNGRTGVSAHRIATRSGMTGWTIAAKHGISAANNASSAAPMKPSRLIPNSCVTGRPSAGDRRSA